MNDPSPLLRYIWYGGLVLAALLAIVIIVEVVLRQSPHLIALFGAGFVPIATIVFSWGAYDGSTISAILLLGLSAGSLWTGIAGLLDLPGSYTLLPTSLLVALSVIGFAMVLLLLVSMPAIYRFSRYEE